MRIRIKSSLVLVVAWLSIIGPSSLPAQEVAGCLIPGLCVASQCRPIATSYPALGTTEPLPGHDGFTPGTRCGIKSCYVILSCPCGPRLGIGVCQGGGTCGGCTPPDICPQSPTLDQINERFDHGWRDLVSAPASVDRKLWSPSALRAGGPTEAPRELTGSTAAFRDRMTNLRDLYVRASVNVYLLEDEMTVGRGTFEYWASDDKFYVRARADRRLGLSHNIEASFDGYEFRLLLLDDSMLVRDTGPHSPVILPFPSPLQVPFYFMSAEECPTCLGSLDSVAHSMSWAKEAYAKLLLRGATTPMKGATHFSVSTNSEGSPTRIEWRNDEETQLLAVAEMTNFREVPEIGPFPMDFALTSFDDAGMPSARIVYQINEMRTNEGANHSEFRVPEERAETVWESQERRFSKHFDAVGEE